MLRVYTSLFSWFTPSLRSNEPHTMERRVRNLLDTRKRVLLCVRCFSIYRRGGAAIEARGIARYRRTVGVRHINEEQEGRRSDGRIAQPTDAVVGDLICVTLITNTRLISSARPIAGDVVHAIVGDDIFGGQDFGRGVCRDTGVAIEVGEGNTDVVSDNSVVVDLGTDGERIAIA